jgi:hypothetical protein
MSGVFQAGSIVGFMKLQMDSWKTGVRTVLADTKAMRKDVATLAADAKRDMATIGMGLIGAGASAGIMAHSFLSAASMTEQYNARLKIMLGDQEKANQLFKDMADFAAKVPFEYREIMESATSLSGVLKGGGEEVGFWMQIIADLAATSGLTIQETTGQVIRMLSAGAGAADLFRERGINAMLGFKAGVEVTAQESREVLINEWSKAGSKFRGATDELAKTWSGQVSMMMDNWFLFRTAVMDAGPFATLKSTLASVNSFLSNNKEMIQAYAKEYANLAFSIGVTAIAMGGLATGMVAVNFASKPVIASLSLIKTLLEALASLGKVTISLATISAAFKGIAVSATAAWSSVAIGAAAVVVPVATITGALTILAGEWGNISKMFKDELSKIGTAFKMVKGYVGDLVNSVVSGLGGAIETVKSFGASVISIVPESVRNAAGYWGKEFGGAAMRDIQTHLVEPAKQMQNRWVGDWQRTKDLIFGTGEYKDFGSIFTSGFDAAKSGLASLLPSTASGAQTVADQTTASMDKMLSDIQKFSTGAADAAGGAADKAKKELEQLVEEGKRLNLELNPVQGMIDEATNSMAALKAAGLATDDNLGLLGGKFAEGWGDKTKEEVDAMLTEMGRLNGGYEMQQGALEALFDVQAKLSQQAKDQLAQQGEGLYNQLNPMAGLQASMTTDLTALTAYMDQLKDSGKEVNINFDELANHYLPQIGDMGADALDELLDKLEVEFPDLIKKLRDELKEALEPDAAIEHYKWLENMGNGIRDVAGQFTRLGTTFKSSVLTNLAKVADFAGNAVSTIGQMGQAFNTVKTMGIMSAKGIAAAFAIATMGITLIIDAIMMAASAFGFMGEKGEEELKGMDAVIDQLSQKSEQWVEEFSQHLLDFLRTGEGGFKEFFNSILDQMFVLGMTELIMKPLMGGITGMFEKGGAFSKGSVVPFASGGIVNQPTAFPMKGGRTGLMGENGEEAIMPLKRLSGGRLGVSAESGGAGGNVFVTIEDHRKSGAPVRTEESRGPNGERMLRMIIHDTVRGMIGNNELDNDMARAYGLQRRGV